MALGHGSKVVTDGLVLALDAANPRSYPGSGTTAYDLVDNSNTASFFNGASFSSSDSGYFEFDGVDDYLSFSISESQSDYSLCIWINFISFTGSIIDRVFSRNSGGTMALAYRSGFNRIQFSYNPIDTNLGSTINNETGQITSGVWYNIQVTNTSSDTSSGNKLYLNGNQVDVNGSSTSLSTGCLLGIGYLENFPSNVKIGNFSIYNKPLTELEIKQNFNALRGRYGL